MALRRLTVSLRTRSRLWVLLGLTVGCTALSMAYFMRYLARPNTGLVAGAPEAVIREGRVVFSPRTPFSIAEAAGLNPERDELLSVNGVPINGTLDVVRAASGVRSFDPIPVVVRRDGADVLTVSITPAFMLSRIDWFFLLVCAVALAYAAFTLTIAVSGEPFSVPLVLAGLCLLVYSCVKPFSHDTPVSNALSQLGSLSPWLLLAFGFSFPSSMGRRWMRGAVFATLVLLFLGFAAARVAYISRWMSSGAEYWLERYGLLGRISNGLAAAAYAGFILIFARTYARSMEAEIKKQVSWMLAGASIALPPVFFFDQLPLVLGDSPSLRMGLGPFTEMFLLVIPVFFLIGLMQNRRFDLGIFLSRYAVHGAVLLVLFAFFSLAYLPLRDLLRSGFRLSQPMGDFFAAGAAVLILMPFGLWISGIMDKRLFKARYRDSPVHISELETQNAELLAALEKAGADHERAARERTLAELRLVLKGITGGLQAPFERILSSLSTLEAGGETRADLSGAVEAGVRVSGMLRTVKHHARRSFSIPSAADMDIVARTAAEIVRRKKPSAVFRFAAGPPPARVSCHPEEMADAISYVLENAVESQDGYGEPIAVRTVSSDSGVAVEIEDSGRGIGDSDWHSVFKPFFTTKPGHLGLGLYFARLITEANGGSLEISPIAAGGTRVRFAFSKTDGCAGPPVSGTSGGHQGQDGGDIGRQD